MSDSVVSLSNVSKRYGGVMALHGVAFDIRIAEVHCLVGENGSGKSTLVKIITGVVQPEPGARIEIEGTPVRSLDPLGAMKRGIHVVHQDLSLFRNLSVAENIHLPFITERSAFAVNWRATRAAARAVLDSMGVKIDPRETLGELSVADQQLVAICRAIASNAKLIILDEPTASLTSADTARLFDFIRGVKAKGISTIFISHRLDEVLEIGDRVTILKNGVLLGTWPAGDLDRDRITSLMTGREISALQPAPAAQGEEVLRVEGMTRHGQFRDVSLSLRRGEVVGLIGLRGAGRTELAHCIFGLTQADSGSIWISGKKARITNNREAMELGIGYVPENRLLQGLVLPQSIANNLALSNLRKVVDAWGLVESPRKRQFAEEAVKDFGVVAASVDEPVSDLSGGNQQKVVLAKWIRRAPKILILDSPTNGVDVGARDSIHRLIEELAAGGMGVLLISDEESEILRTCSRILVMKTGRIAGEYRASEITEQELRERIRAAEVGART